eukprot:7556451-Pyramimonas_sp.AAC.1
MMCVLLLFHFQSMSVGISQCDGPLNDRNDESNSPVWSFVTAGCGCWFVLVCGFAYPRHIFVKFPKTLKLEECVPQVY